MVLVHCNVFSLGNVLSFRKTTFFLGLTVASFSSNSLIYLHTELVHLD